MSANPEKFPQEVIDNVRNYHMREGNLKTELAVSHNKNSSDASILSFEGFGGETMKNKLFTNIYYYRPTVYVYNVRIFKDIYHF